MPVAAPTATTTEAAATIAPRRAARLRSDPRAARRWARSLTRAAPPSPGGGRVPPFWGSAGPAGTSASLKLRLCPHGAMRTIPQPSRHPVDASVSRMRALDAALPDAGRGGGLQPRLPRRHGGGRPAHRQAVGSRTRGRRSRWTCGSRSGILDAVEAAADERRPPACWRPAVPVPPPSRRTSAAVRARGHQRAHRARSGARRGGHLSYARLRTRRAGGRVRPRGRSPRLAGGAHPRRAMPGPDLLQIADPLTHLLGSWSLDRARGRHVDGGPGAVGAARLPESPGSSPSGWTRPGL